MKKKPRVLIKMFFFFVFPYLDEIFILSRIPLWWFAMNSQHVFANLATFSPDESIIIKRIIQTAVWNIILTRKRKKIYNNNGLVGRVSN